MVESINKRSVPNGHITEKWFWFDDNTLDKCKIYYYGRTTVHGSSDDYRFTVEGLTNGKTKSIVIDASIKPDPGFNSKREAIAYKVKSIKQLNKVLEGDIHDIRLRIKNNEKFIAKVKLV